MLRWYGYVGLALLLFAQANFFLRIAPFAEWYIPIVWYGYILFVDSLVYRIKGQSLISNYTKEFFLMALVSLPFWTIFEVYNLFTLSWVYVNYVWYVHVTDFTTIMPAVLETFMLVRALGIAKNAHIGRPHRRISVRSDDRRLWHVVRFLPVLGLASCVVPLVVPSVGFPFVWLGLFLLLDPINFMTGRPSLIQKYARDETGTTMQLFVAGIVMGFFWEFWNYMAVPQWVYTVPPFLPNVRLFEMPVYGYLGYFPFALDVFLFYALARSLFFRGKNPLLAIE